MPCYLYPCPGATRRPSYLHETGGLNGNWALDFMCQQGAQVLAPQDCVVVKLSGRSPSDGVQPGAVFGYSLHLRDEDGYRYFMTHLGRRVVKEGQKVCRGQRVAYIAGWPNDPGRTHLHLGVTSPKSEADAKVQIKAISAAYKVRPVE